jgi:Tol biopolymer transport system component
MTRGRSYGFGILWSVVMITLFLTACGGPSSEFTYRVSGEDTSKASVRYADAKGNLQEKQVDLPWETTIGVGGKFDAEISVTNEEATGTVTCEIWLDGRKIGDSSSAIYARCYDAYAGNGNSTFNSFVGSSVEKYLGKAQDYTNQRDYDKALQEIARAVEVAPYFPDVYHQQANVYAKMDEFDQALAAYNRAIELDPERVLAYFDRAATYWAMDDREAAIADLTTALELNPDFVNGYMARAVIYGELGDLEAATADVLQVQALRDDPDTQVWVKDKLRQYASGPRIDARLVFVSQRDGNVDIYTINADGSHEQRLTDHPGLDDMPVWSPDGQKIAFVSDRDGNKEIYLMDADGGNVQRVTNHPAVDQMPVWAPNSKALAFVSERNGNADILIFNLEKEELTQLTDSPANDWHPAWSPNTPELAYVSDADGDPDLYIINADLEIRRLTDNTVGDSQPAWSPDGRLIAFTVTEDGKNSDLYIIRPDGTGLQRITETPGLNNNPAWSPDSEYLAFSSDRDGNPEIYVMTLSGELYRVTDNDTVDVRPRWGPPLGP